MKHVLKNTNLHIIFSITLLAVMGVSIITPTFPLIVKEFDITSQEIGLLITMFTLPGIFLTPFLGILADRYGRKTILIPAIFLFGLAGGACAFTRNFNLLLLFRFFQGMGAASLGSLNVTLIGDIFHGQDRISAMGYNASVLSIGTASYPAIGGGLAMFGWFYPFLFPLLAIPLGLWILLSLTNPEPENSQKLSEYLQNTFRSIKQKKVIGLFLLNVLTFIILYGTFLTYIPLKLADSFQASPAVIGLIMSAASVTSAVTSSQLGNLSRHIKKNRLIQIAIMLYMVTLIVVTLVPSLWYMLIPAVLYGMAQGMNIPTLQTLLVGLAPIEYRAAFMSINGMILRLGQTLGPLVTGVAYGLMGIDGAFWGGAVVAAVMMGTVLSMKW